MGIGAPLAGALAAGRSRFNARVAATRHRHPGFDEAAFSAFLVGSLDPLITAVDAVAPDRVGAVTLVGFELALVLVAKGHAGREARKPWVDRLWQNVAPGYARLIAANPQAVLGSLCNAVVQLAQWPGVRIERWLEQLASLSDQVQSEAQLLSLGQLLAWRAGMAHYRCGALEAAEALSPALALAALGSEGSDWPTLRAALLEDPWHVAAGDAELPAGGMQVGAFTGFGGRFAEPPQLRAGDDGFWVRSGDRHFLLVADLHGAVLLPAAAESFEAAAAGSKPPAEASGQLAALGWPADGLACASNAQSVALSSPFTHAIAVFPRT